MIQYKSGQIVYQLWVGKLFKVKIEKFLPKSNRYRVTQIDTDSTPYLPTLVDADRLFPTRKAYYESQLDKINSDICKLESRKQEIESKLHDTEEGIKTKCAYHPNEDTTALFCPLKPCSGCPHNEAIQ